MKTFESRLIDATQPLRFHALAINIHHLFQTGMYELLWEHGPLSAPDIADRLGLDAARVEVFLVYLGNEGMLDSSRSGFSLSEAGLKLREFRPWYTMFVGGYNETFMQIGDKLRPSSGFASRNLGDVGSGSCGISHYDAIPLTRRLMAKAPGKCTRMLDMGCGNGRYLVEFCKALPEIVSAWGVEPSADGCREAEALIASSGLGDRVRIVNDSAVHFLSTRADFDVDFAVIGFVLHEILGQEGPSGVKDFLRALFDRFPDLHLIVIEVDQQMSSPEVMKHGLALAYYNPYYLLHPFTNQRLETQSFWEGLFAECGLEMVAKEFTDPEVDSTKLEVGYLLRKQKV